MRWHPYTTRTRHFAYAGALPGLVAFEVGTPCLATRLPDYQVALTFDDLSIILGEDWYIVGVEEPHSVPPKWVRDVQAVEDAYFIEIINRALEVLSGESKVEDVAGACLATDGIE